jgi:ribokinase
MPMNDSFDGRPRIVVVGSTNTDLVTRVARIPAPGETVLGGDLEIVAGGKGANQAVAAARLGGDVTFVARVGDDAFGKNALDSFRREGLNVAHVSVTPGVPSGVALISVSETTGDNAIVVAPGANARLAPDDVDAAAIAFDAARAVVVSLEVPLETVARAVEIAHAHKIPIVLNPAPARPLPPDMLARVSLLTPNESEARLLCGHSDDFSSLDELAALLDLGVQTAVVTLGARGAALVTPDGIEHVPGLPVAAVDTVAAGDCFTGALAVEIARGRPLRDAARFACAAAALSVTKKGAQPALPTRQEVETFLSS